MNAVLVVLTLASLAAAVVATFIAWRVVGENRRRSEARVAHLAEAVHALEPRESEPVGVAHLLDQPDDPPARRIAPLAVAGVGLLALIVFVTVARGVSRSEAPTTADSTAETHQTPSPAVVDLVSLTHERGADGQLELRGEVRGRSNGAMMEHITAVALLFDRQGAYLSSSRAPLEPHTTSDGAAAAFFISVPDAERVGRYRVSFRDGDRVVPHVDRRATAATEAGS
jgi:hypothetical protein